MLTIVRDLYVGWLCLRRRPSSLPAVHFFSLSLRSPPPSTEGVSEHVQLAFRLPTPFPTPPLATLGAQIATWAEQGGRTSAAVNKAAIGVPSAPLPHLCGCLFGHVSCSLPSARLRTCNPEKRAHLPKEGRGKLDLGERSLKWGGLACDTNSRGSLQRVEATKLLVHLCISKC